MSDRKRKVAPSESEAGEARSGVSGDGVLDSGATLTSGRPVRKRRPPAKLRDAGSDDEINEAGGDGELDGSRRVATRSRASVANRVRVLRSARSGERSATRDDDAEDAAGTGIGAVDEVVQSVVRQRCSLSAWSLTRRRSQRASAASTRGRSATRSVGQDDAGVDEESVIDDATSVAVS